MEYGKLTQAVACKKMQLPTCHRISPLDGWRISPEEKFKDSADGPTYTPDVLPLDPDHVTVRGFHPISDTWYVQAGTGAYVCVGA